MTAKRVFHHPACYIFYLVLGLAVILVVELVMNSQTIWTKTINRGRGT